MTLCAPPPLNFDLISRAHVSSLFHYQVLEKLYRSKWGQYDGLGALILTPTRELAMQIFDELRKVGKHHDMSAGLLIGGKNVKEEQDRVAGDSPKI